jgi:Pyridoxamine 5'-phosphate oxidase
VASEPTPGPVQTTEGYGLGDAPADGSALSWPTVVGWLTTARNYWVCTTRTDGRPHAMPVWGLWVDDAIWFSTDPTSIKGRNLHARPDVVVHLESGDEVCVIEGRAIRVEDRAALTDFDDRYDAKYQVRPSAMGDAAGVYAVKPTTALVWTEADFPTTATRFAF